MKYAVYGVSTWEEDAGELFLIFAHKEFETAEQAAAAARALYHPELQTVVRRAIEEIV